MAGRTPERGRRAASSRPTSPRPDPMSFCPPRNRGGRGKRDIVVVENYGERDISPTSTLRCRTLILTVYYARPLCLPAEMLNLPEEEEEEKRGSTTLFLSGQDPLCFNPLMGQGWRSG